MAEVNDQDITMAAHEWYTELCKQGADEGNEKLLIVHLAVEILTRWEEKAETEMGFRDKCNGYKNQAQNVIMDVVKAIRAICD